ncbi:MlaD family protein [Carboxylicivirga marina]|uniref:MCE family protein n=1 Tax=Carboxylicivirga marina TaxID=2800988 RepID=A0ABS1HER6_9BACT|nr:MlaD family protein [Carboxylicivirga marina]MBK3516123.1 MCE family protein [Carboxylicivirga marina]
MKNRAQKIRLGLFLLVSLAALISSLIFFTAREYFKKEDTYYVSYEDLSVSGLDAGSPVKYMGILVGSIKDIRIDPDNVNIVIVELALKPETPVKEDASANITSMGITGLKAIEISGGTNKSKALKPGSFIKAGSSFSDQISGKAEVIAKKVEKVLNNLLLFTEPNNLNKITIMADNASMALINMDSLIVENRLDIRNAIIPLKDISYRLDETSRLLLSTIEAVHSKAKSDTIDQIFSNIRDVSMKLNETDFKTLVADITAIANQIDLLLSKVDNDLDRGSQDFSESLQLLRLTLENLNQAAIKINNDPSILIRGTNQKNTPDNKLTE